MRVLYVAPFIATFATIVFLPVFRWWASHLRMLLFRQQNAWFSCFVSGITVSFTGFGPVFGSIFLFCGRNHKRPHCQFCDLLLPCVTASCMLFMSGWFGFVGHRDSGRCGTAHAQTNGSWWDGSRSFFFMCDAVAMIHVMIKQGPPRLGWPLFFSRKRPLGVSGLV